MVSNHLNIYGDLRILYFANNQILASGFISVTYVNDLSDYIKEISNLNPNHSDGHLLYRGHGDKRYRAEPSVFRRKDWSNREHEMLRQLLAEHPTEFSRDVNTFEYLARAQHYGLPTRLLDVTRNPLVALFFACNDSTQPQTSIRRYAGEVVVFLPNKNRQRFFDSETVACLSSLTYLSAEKKMDVRKHLISCRETADSDSESMSEFDRLFVERFNDNNNVREIISMLKKENPSIGDQIHPIDLTRIVTVLPRKLDERIASQSAAFLIFGLFNPERENTKYLFLQNILERKEIYISPKNKSRILNELDTLGINQETLFPSLDKTADKIKRSYGEQRSTTMQKTT